MVKEGKQIRVAVMGCGTVGSGAMRMISENADALTKATGERIELAYALDMREIAPLYGAKWTNRFDDLIEDGALDIAIETIGGATHAHQFTRRLLEAGISVVTSNKELVVRHGAELIELARQHGAHYLYEAAVGGGVPILRPLRTDLAGNRILKICGIVNGSTNYILTRMSQSGISFSAALAEAKSLNYAEADAAADVDGWDACRKLAILAHSAFGAQFSDWESVPIEGIRQITERDIACARAIGGEIKLIAQCEAQLNGWTGFVHPTLVLADHPLRHVRDVFNGIVVTGDAVGDVMFYGRGAGSMPTASAVMGDVIELARGMKPDWGVHAVAPFAKADAGEVQWMVRIEPSGEGTAWTAVSKYLPQASVQKVDDMLAVTTPKLARVALEAALAHIHEAGHRTGIALRVLTASADV